MSEILVNKLTGKTTANDITVTVGATATQSLEQGLAKVWCKWNSSVTVDDSFNQSSMVDNGTANYEVVFTNDFAAASKFAAAGLSGQYAVAGAFVSWTGGGNNTAHADRIKVQCLNSSGSEAAADKNTIIIHGDLA